ncbi:MAG TPA: ABC-2 family transporter protein, partial [Anaerolineales bacterium]
MNTVRLFWAYLKVNVQLALAYRAEAVVNILLNLLWLGWELLSLSIIFANTPTLGGWGPGELIALLGVFRLVNAMMAAVIWPNTEKFNTAIRDGSWDYTLLQPVSSMFLVTFSNLVIWRVWDLALAAVLIGVGVSMSGGGASLAGLLIFAALVA